MNVLIISSGEIINCDLLKEEIKNSDYIICADGGLDHLLNIEELPDIVVGDLDSISKDSMKYIKDNNIEVLKFPSRKNMTDSELAIELAKDKGAKNITLIGSTGTRLDHSLGNIFLLKRISEWGIEAKLVNNTNVIRYVSSNLDIKKNENFKYVSIIPIDLNGAIVSLSGFIYPLDRYKIDYTSTIGISNEIEDISACIDIHEGEVLVIESKD